MRETLFNMVAGAPAGDLDQWSVRVKFTVNEKQAAAIVALREVLLRDSYDAIEVWIAPGTRPDPKGREAIHKVEWIVSRSPLDDEEGEEGEDDGSLDFSDDTRPLDATHIRVVEKGFSIVSSFFDGNYSTFSIETDLIEFSELDELLGK